MSRRDHILKMLLHQLHALTKHPSLIGKNKGKSPDSVNRFMTKDNKLKGNKF